MEKEPKFESKPEREHDLLDLTLEEKHALQQRIKKWNGLIRIFVHPMFEKWRGHEKEYVHDPAQVKILQIEKVLSQLLSMEEIRTPPIVIMEERMYLEKLKQWLRENPSDSLRQAVYYVNTWAKNPLPMNDAPDEAESWRDFSKLLKDLGVKKILMGGMQLKVGGYQRDWTKKDPFVERCVGIALSHLSKDKAGEFEVELSSLIHPSGEREEYNSVVKKPK